MKARVSPKDHLFRATLTRMLFRQPNQKAGKARPALQGRDVHLRHFPRDADIGFYWRSTQGSDNSIAPDNTPVHAAHGFVIGLNIIQCCHLTLAVIDGARIVGPASGDQAGQAIAIFSPTWPDHSFISHSNTVAASPRNARNPNTSVTVVNSTVDALPLSLNFQPLSFARWQLIARMEEGLKAQQEDFGFSENDIDEVRRLIADTKTWLLAVTMLASVLHLLFEFLAFKSDVDFWKNNKSLRGLSARSVVVDLISQIVVLAYLVDQGSSLLVSIPAAGAILIQCWKVEKATGVRPDFSRPFPWIRCERLEAVALSAKNAKADDKGAQLDAATLRVDRLATLYLSLSLGPLVIGYAVKTLIYDAHLGWYSWGLGAMTNAVYTGGFILMTPQLALNYHLKSVSHLPWRLLCFRFVNTFIDDLFAFVIKMPVMHRVSCFRDDVVFLIYLYQRRIYSVDMSRGVAGEDAAQ